MNLLASVRNLQEARVATSAGVDIIDLKEPRLGSLGPVSWQEASRVVSELAHRVPVSLALGELREYASRPRPHAFPWHECKFAKMGLAHCLGLPNWQRQWQAWADSLTGLVTPVAVAYADHQRCSAPDLSEVIELAIACQVRFFLVDTFVKDGQSLFDYYTATELQQVLRPLRQRHVGIAIAGSVTHRMLDRVAQLRPDVVAVRGAICGNGIRSGTVCAQQLATFRKHLFDVCRTGPGLDRQDPGKPQWS